MADVLIRTSCVAEISSALSSSESVRHKKKRMFKAIGTIMILWYLSHLFVHSFVSLDSALSETFITMEAAAVSARTQLE